MDFLGLINGDNLFKYCFTLGLVMLVFALIYPLEKSHQIEIEVINQNKEASLLTNEINNLKKSIDKLEEDIKTMLSADKSIDKNIAQKKVFQINSDYQVIEKNKNDLRMKSIVLDFNYRRIKTLETQAKTFSKFSWVMIIVGISLAIFGFIYWVKNTFREMKEKVKK